MSIRKQRANEIARLLEEYFPEVPIPLAHENPYTLLVAVLLSAQCTDERVNQVTPLLFAKANHPEDMIKLEPDEIREIIKPCGLSPTKSKAIHRLSEMLVEKHQSEVPEDMELLEQLPGVGHKTASVVMAQAFGQPAFPVDTHIHRLAYRWNLSTGKSVEKTEKDLKNLFDKSIWNKLHLQIIYFGRKYCPARGHNPYECPICKLYGRKRLFSDYDKAQFLKTIKNNKPGFKRIKKNN